MVDILLDETGDIALHNGDISLSDSLKQAVMIKLRWFMGEWKFNPDLGIPYYEEVFNKRVSIDSVKAMLEETLLEIDGVVSVKQLDITYRRVERRFDIIFVVEGEKDKVIKEEVNIIV